MFEEKILSDFFWLKLFEKKNLVKNNMVKKKDKQNLVTTLVKGAVTTSLACVRSNSESPGTSSGG